MSASHKHNLHFSQPGMSKTPSSTSESSVEGSECSTDGSETEELMRRLLCRPQYVPPASGAGPPAMTSRLLDFKWNPSKDLAMARLVESLKIIESDDVCFVCDDKKPAASFCFNCSIKMCLACSKAHGKIPATREHELEELGKLTPDQLTITRKSSCAIHQGRQAEFFCPQHGAAFCIACWTKHMPCPEIRRIAVVIETEQPAKDEIRIKEKNRKFEWTDDLERNRRLERNCDLERTGRQERNDVISRNADGRPEIRQDTPTSGTRLTTLRIGDRVQRGRGWLQSRGNQDGTPPGPGTVLNVGPGILLSKGEVIVLWDAGGKGIYYMGYNNLYELEAA